MEIKVTKKDIAWSYAAQIFSLGTGLFTLPAILKLLNGDEVGLNYILVSINSIIALFDMGFSSQFSRYLTYTFSGAQSIQKEGLAGEYSCTLNRHLLAIIIQTAKSIYRIISAIALLCLLTLGTIYVWHITEGFTLVKNSRFVWFIFCLSSFFHIYYLYLNVFLQGRGFIKESKQATVYSRLVQLAITFAMLFSGCGLISVVIANFIAPFAFRYFAYRYFYTNDIKEIILHEKVSRKELRSTFKILFYNAKKIGIIAILSSILGNASTLVIGIFLSLPEVGSFGIMVQLLGIIGNVSNTFLYSKIPEFGNLLIKQKMITLRKEFGFSMFIYYFFYLGGLVCLMFMPLVFRFFGFNVQLPPVSILALYGITRFVEQNQSAYCQLLVVQNNLIYYKSAILTCIVQFVLLYLFLRLGLGILGVVIAQAIPLYAYCAWKWPLYAVKKFNISISRDTILNPIITVKKKIWTNE